MQFTLKVLFHDLDQFQPFQPYKSEFQTLPDLKNTTSKFNQFPRILSTCGNSGFVCVLCKNGCPKLGQTLRDRMSEEREEERKERGEKKK